MGSEIKDLQRLCIHTITTKPLGFEVACAKYAALGVKGISIWRDAVAGLPPRTVINCLKNSDLSAVSYVRGGFFPALDADKRAAAIEDNLLMLQEAAEMEIPMLVLVCGQNRVSPWRPQESRSKPGLKPCFPGPGSSR